MLRLWLGGVGLVAGLGAIAVPVVLMVIYIVTFAYTASPDTGFNILTFGALLGLIGAGLGALLALVMLCFPVTRLLAAGYFIGAGIAVICAVIAAAIIAALPLP